ncbi:NAD+ kinase [Sporobacter termitidis DSM 10068]|uniref:NAD kinase n=1 Tax=Sporobacter termitidis DSM 10068 TaxID=1123282 RepID=A0A1M5Y7P7_9FIRM|nr:NAD(+)/NADH kinase [Sporobacter termitidis]SHI08111.1 NAD+ kinase [Sporobacter termitidis DSM 10068]
MKRVLLCPNLNRDRDLALTLEVRDMLKKCGASTVVCPLFEEQCPLPPLEGVEVVPLESALESADMIIAFGGDGTILRAARAAASASVPVLGVNMGTMGFMAELEKEDIGLIPKAVCGEYAIDRRMMLDVELMRDGSVIYRDFALNDVVIAGMTKVIDLTLYGDGQEITHFSGDGVIVATPTGSTAYSMAAGGPIIEPSAENIIVTPICAHVLAAKAFVLEPERRVMVELGHVKANPAYLSVDGGVYLNLVSGDKVNVHKSSKKTLLVHLSDRSFYKKVSEKLGEKF